MSRPHASDPSAEPDRRAAFLARAGIVHQSWDGSAGTGTAAALAQALPVPGAQGAWMPLQVSPDAPAQAGVAEVWCIVRGEGVLGFVPPGQPEHTAPLQAGDLLHFPAGVRRRLRSSAERPIEVLRRAIVAA